MTVKLLIEHHLEFLSLKGCYTGSSESIHVKMQHCCKSHVAAHLLIGECFSLIFKIIRIYMFYTGAEQRQELDTVINRMEAEREKLQAEVKKLKRDLAERDSETSSFEMRVNQRNVQLIDLQEQINDKTEEVSQLEKQVSTRALGDREKRLLNTH